MNKFGLYIHWPFCIKKCPYCDFNSYALKYTPQMWVDALVKELDNYQTIFKNYEIQTVFFGGGTPSLIPPTSIKTILDKVFSIWPKPDEIEITLEVNPSTIETHALDDFLFNGINRFSIGMQSLRDENLQFLGRLHNSAEAIKIATYAASICNNVSCDFIYALPHDSLKSWKIDLNNILELANKINLKHLSLYELVIEENTVFEKEVQNHEWLPMEDDMQSILYEYTNSMLIKNEFFPYEISNAAKSQKFQSKHNLIYWRYGNYLGIGAGAHSRMELAGLGKIKMANLKNPYKWLDSINNCSSLNEESIKTIPDFAVLDSIVQLHEKLLMGLRLSEGIVIDDQEMALINKKALDMLLEKKFMSADNNVYAATLNGRLKLHSILKLLCE